MNYKLFLIFICFLCFSCKNNLENKKEEIEIIATINGEKIDKKYLDSITANEVYELRFSTLKEKITNKLIEEEAKMKKMNTYEFITNYNSTEVDSLIQVELKRNNYEQVAKIDSSQAIGIYKTAEYIAKRNILGKEIVNNKEIEVFLEKDFHQTFSGKLDGSYLLPPNHRLNKEIIVISNYECIYCYNFHQKMKSLIESNTSDFNFKFVYFGDQILKFASAPIASGEQGKFNEMNDFIFEKVQNGTISDSIIFEFAKELHLNIEKFKTDYTSAQAYKKLDANRTMILSNNIYSTPTLIIDNKIYDEPNKINILKRKINGQE